MTIPEFGWLFSCNSQDRILGAEVSPELRTKSNPGILLPGRLCSIGEQEDCNPNILKGSVSCRCFFPKSEIIRRWRISRLLTLAENNIADVVEPLLKIQPGFVCMVLLVVSLN